MNQVADGLTDEQLVSEYQQSPDSARRADCVNELFRRHQARVALWCLRIAGQREQAADLAQEVFIKAFTKLDSFRSESKFSTWLYAIARHHCFNFLRAQSRAADAAGEELLRDVADTAPGPDSRLQHEAARKLLTELLDQSLDAVERKVFVLHFAEGLPLDAITRLLELENTSGAKAYIVSAKRKLKRAVERWRATQQRLSPGGAPSEASRSGAQRRSF